MTGPIDGKSRNEEVKIGSERSFGMVFAVVFALIGSWPYFKGNDPHLWALGTAIAFFVISLIIPRMLRPLNLLWFRFGLLLHKIISPLIMGLVFFLVVTPIAFVMRLSGKDLLNLRFDPQASSYWIKRDPPGPDSQSMSNQF